MKRVEGKIAIVTGASLNEYGVGIGGATALTLAREGARLVLGNRTEAGAHALAEKIRSEGGEAVACGLDQGSEESVASLVALAAAHFGGVDILVNNAAAVLAEDTDLLGTSAATWDRIMAVNPRGVFLMSKYSLPHMLARGGGSIVNISSGSGLLGDISRIAYGSSKGAINILTKYIATMYGKQNIRCNAVLPGLVVSAKSKETGSDAVYEIFHKHTLTPHLGDPQHLANFILFLASDEAAFITGAVISADGGLLAHQTYSSDLLALPIDQINTGAS